MSSNDTIKQEIDAKKKKLEELKQKRIQRQNSLTPANTTSTTALHSITNTKSPNSAKSKLTKTITHTDDVLNSVNTLLSSAVKSPRTSRPSINSASKTKLTSPRSSTIVSPSVKSPVTERRISVTPAKAIVNAVPQHTPNTARTQSITTPSVVKKVILGTSDIVTTEIPSVEHIQYEQTTQTDDVTITNQNTDEIDIVALHETANNAKRIESELNQQIQQLQQQLQQYTHTDTAHTTNTAGIVATPQFEQFVTKQSHVIERILEYNDTYDPLIDYETVDTTTNKQSSKLNNTTEYLIEHSIFHNDIVDGRPVTSIDWSHKHKELILTAYAGRNDTEPNLNDSVDLTQQSISSINNTNNGELYIWNLHLPNKPEYKFQCNTTVTTAQFHPSQHNIIIATTWSGQVILYDIRNNKQTAIARSSLQYSHTQPIHSSYITHNVLTGGITQSNTNIITLSHDGHICVWQDNMLTKPIHEFILKSNNTANTTVSTDIISYCSDFSTKDTTQCYIGTDDGTVHTGKLYENKDIVTDAYNAHTAPITGLQFHPCSKQSTNTNSVLQQLYLTSSYDWTVKLWSSDTNKHKRQASLNKVDSAANTTQSTEHKPLYTFESCNDYIYDVKWHPKNVGLFATGAGNGQVALYNLLDENPDLAIYKHDVNKKGANSTDHTAGNVAISKLNFNDDGDMLAAGTSTGKLYLYNVDSNITQSNREATSQLADKLSRLG